MDYPSVFERDFGFQIKWSGVEGIGRCPNPHHEDSKPSCSFNADKGVIYCHSCGYKANCYSYAKEQGLDNPHQYIKNESYGEIRINRPLKTEDRTPKMSADELNKMKDEYYANLTESDKVFTGDPIIFSAILFVTPITFVGFTALSVETNTNLSTE